MEKRINDTGDEGAALSPPPFPHSSLHPFLSFSLTAHRISCLIFHFPLSQFLHIHFTVCHISPITMIVFFTPLVAEQDFLCKICMDSPIDCVLLECGHMLTCVRCGRQLSECPICRQYVSRVVHAFKV